jgi:SulP family sulfate permease
MNSLTALCDTCEKKGIKLVFSHVNEQPMKIMEKSNFVDRVGRENFCVHIDDALERAKQLVEVA